MRDPRIDAARERSIHEWQEFCRFPSVAGDLDAINAAADWLEQKLRALSDRIERIEIPEYGPVVVAYFPGISTTTLMLYNHYDVQPAGELDRWESGPFDSQIRDGALYARGACDDKADVTSRLRALELFIEDHPEGLPYSIIYLADPCEEIGSPGLETVLGENSERLSSDAVLWESYLREDDGRPAVGFGCRGAMEISLSLNILASNQHPSYSQILRSAPLELMRAITSLVDQDGLIVVPGFTESALRPDAAAKARTQELSLPGDAISLPGISPLQNFSEEELKERFIFTPSMSLSGFDLDPGVGQSIPASGSARVRFGLVPGMDPHACFDSVKSFLSTTAPDIVVELIRTMQPAFSPVDTPFAVSVLEAAANAFEAKPVIYDVMTGSGPGAFFLEHLGAPLISPTGTLRPEGNMHGYNEHGYLEDYLTHIQFTFDLLNNLEAHEFATND
ncbi:Acetylornithine deacetylase/Succinyl-diaminopimelate desuccinylase and [Leifsonia rubra CMS 76R]|nr:Acetylornithine deacetylase/Succinyl-diaminopimelate desuccinylase and [Leifsonia rubra CMS 76R]